MAIERKILTATALSTWREQLRREGKRLVVTNGCFDILHLGHVTYLENARALGDALLVGVNSDSTVRELKGPTRPINSERERAAILAALEAVDAASIFNELRATSFLERIRPDIYVKGGDYTLETICQEERRLLEQMGAKIVILPVVHGKSTTTLLEKIAQR